MNALALLESAMIARVALRVARERKNTTRAVVVAPKRFGKGRTAKASSAESILRYCLRQRGWSRQWRRGELTGKQHLGLLEDIRQYGRAWLRHEAEAFFDHYGVEVEVERGIADRAAGALGRFFDRSKQFVRELVFAGYMAMKGPEPLNADEVASLDNAAKVQSQYFDKFQHEVQFSPPQEIADPDSLVTVVSPAPMTPGQFVARAEQYGNSVWQSTVNAHRAVTTRQGVMQEERRILGQPKGEHCPDCPPLAALGWQPLGTLPALGDTECGSLCLCHFEFRDAKQPAIPSLPSTGGPPEKKQRPPKGSPPKGKPEPSVVPTLQEQIEEAKQAGHTFSGVEYEEL